MKIFTKNIVLILFVAIFISFWNVTDGVVLGDSRDDNSTSENIVTNARNSQEDLISEYQDLKSKCDDLSSKLKDLIQQVNSLQEDNRQFLILVEDDQIE